LDLGEAERLGGVLEAISHIELAPVLNSVPASWPVTDQELDCLGWFLERRATGVAARLRGLTRKGGGQ
jgi:hypothetical protein